MIRFIILATVSLSAALPADACRLQSASGKSTMIELFTSEGCSSCPPADRWLSQLKSSPLLWKKIIPIAFHVDYWDYLGWKDRLASNRNSLRQRTYRQKGHTSAVYTPGFFLNGQEWRPGGKAVKQTYPNPGVLSAKVQSNYIQVKFNSTLKAAKQAWVHIALLGMNITNHIKSGENQGNDLRHDFVVLSHQKHAVKFDGAKSQWHLPLTKTASNDPTKAIVVWVSLGSDPSPIQAAGNWCSL